MTYKAYLFDFDYTLADSSRGIVTCFRNVLLRHGYSQVGEYNIKRTIGKTLEESFSILTGITNEQQIAAFKEEYVEEAKIHMTANTFLYPETSNVLQSLKECGARLGIISTKFRFRINELLRQHFDEGFFNIIIGGEDVQHAKPHPEGLLLAIHHLDLTPADVLYIGDSVVDAQTAQAANVDFAGILHGMTTIDELLPYPHRLIAPNLEGIVA